MSRFLVLIVTLLTIIRPPFLKPGDKVAIVSPSFAPMDTVSFNRGIGVIRSWGLEPVIFDHAVIDPIKDEKNRIRNYYAGSKEERVEDLLMAYADDSIKAIICSRGGYGAIQLIDLMPLSTYSDHPKWLVGYSDITTLHSASTLSGVMSIHGDMVTSFGAKKEVSEYSTAVKDLLFGSIPATYVEHSDYDVTGSAEGTLIGGNMVTFQALAGTKYDASQLDSCILFIEEVEESMHVLDRFFRILSLNGRIPNIKGIVVGSMTGIREEMAYHDAYAAISQYTKELGIPVCFGFPAGHGKKNMPLIMGATVKLNVTPEGSTLTYEF